MGDRTITSIFFDGQFWVAEIERHVSDRVETARYCFGPEPSNGELLDWVGHAFSRLVFRVSDLKGDERGEARLSAKRARRSGKAEADRVGFSSKASESIKIALAQHKRQASIDKRARDEEQQELRWALRDRKRKARRRGH